MLHTRDLKFLGQQVFVTIFIYFNLKIKPIFTKNVHHKYAEIMEKIMYTYVVILNHFVSKKMC